MARTMKAAILRKLRTPLRIETRPVPEPKPGEVLVRVVACGVCHSDLHAVDGDWTPGPVLPLIPGHEVVGHVAALGDGATDLKVGDAIGVPWMYSACGACDLCLAGHETVCPKGEATGYTKPGGYAEYMVAAAAFVGALPKRADLYRLAPILCAGVTTYRGLKKTNVRAGEWMTVIGVGGLGHLAIQYARAMGMRIVAIDIDDAKLRLARRFGAEVAVNAAADDAAAVIKRRIGGSHGAVVAAISPRAFEQALQVLRPGAHARISASQPAPATPSAAPSRQSSIPNSPSADQASVRAAICARRSHLLPTAGSAQRSNCGLSNKSIGYCRGCEKAG